MAVEQNGFLNIGGGAIPGNATVQDFQGQTIVQSVTYNVSQAGEWEEGDQITGRVTDFGNGLTITKVMDNGSPSLAHACAMKTQFDDAVLNLVAGSESYLEVTLEKVIICDVQVNYNTGQNRPEEVVTLKYRKATWRYGTATMSYDLAQNAG